MAKYLPCECKWNLMKQKRENYFDSETKILSSGRLSVQQKVNKKNIEFSLNIHVRLFLMWCAKFYQNSDPL